MRNITGLYAWDLEKGYKGKYSDPFELNKIMIRKCKIECSSCGKLESCKKYIRNSYRIVRMSIHDKEIKQSDTTSKSTKSDITPTNEIKVRRYSACIFSGTPD